MIQSSYITYLNNPQSIYVMNYILQIQPIKLDKDVLEIVCGPIIKIYIVRLCHIDNSLCIS